MKWGRGSGVQHSVVTWTGASVQRLPCNPRVTVEGWLTAEAIWEESVALQGLRGDIHVGLGVAMLHV